MSEDVSAQVRVGCTIILVAALVAAVLNLMVVAQSILSSGMSTLQAGTERVAVQEFENYNMKKRTGTEVKSAMTLYMNRDIAICVKTLAGDKVNQYGAQLDTTEFKVADGKTYIQAEYKTDTTTGAIEFNGDISGTVTKSNTKEFIVESKRFNSTLIKNSLGDIVGIYFEQLAE